jgi:hypothetical protein
MHMTMPPTPSSKRVQWSIALLWAALGAALLLQLLYVDLNVRAAFRALMGGLILVFGLYAYLTVGISKGRASARLIYTILFTGGLVLSPPNIAGFGADPVIVLVELAQVLAQVLAFATLFTPQANAWFKQQAPAPKAHER